MDKVPSILNNAYLQGGYPLLFIAVLVLTLVASWWFVVRALWNDLKNSRDRERAMTERVVVMGETTRATNENTKGAIESIQKELITIGVRYEEQARTHIAQYEASSAQRNEIVALLTRRR